LDTVPPVGPSPDHAQEYVAPRPLPKPADHLTIEDIPVKVAPQPDPRNMKTQKAMYVLKREEAEKALAEMGIAPSATSPNPSQPDQPVPVPPALAPAATPEAAPKRSNAWIVILVIVLLLAGLAAFAIQYWLGSVASETPAPTATITGALAAPTPTRAPPAPKPPSRTTPAAAKTAATATTPATTAPTAEPAAAAAVPSKPVPQKNEPRPINE